ncbi:MAG: sigma-70 family RNA polymerase sigma factor [Clostridia bacterium]|nr:sigma-70 family RNA polymerase sigma factor [Clostridia bacterium]
MSQHWQENHPNPTDEQLALGAQGGDDGCRLQLITRYIPVVKARVSGYADSGLEPEDLAQEGMIGLMGAIDFYDPDRGASFHTFALLCIDRSVISVVRASLAAKKIPRSTLVPLEDFEAESPRDDNPEDIVVANESAHLLTAKMQQVLSALEWRVFFLYLGGCEYEDIAGRLQISPKAVDNALCRARSKIRSIRL